MYELNDLLEAVIGADPKILRILKVVVQERDRLRKLVEVKDEQIKTLQANLELARFEET